MPSEWWPLRSKSLAPAAIVARTARRSHAEKYHHDRTDRCRQDGNSADVSLGLLKRRSSKWRRPNSRRSGYVGRDVESIIRDLTELSINMVKTSRLEAVQQKRNNMGEERLLDLLLPPPPSRTDSLGRLERRGDPSAAMIL